MLLFYDCLVKTHGNIVETRQIVYVTDTSDKLFISKQACIALGMISINFSMIGEANGNTRPT